MSEQEQVVLESKASPEVQAKAEKLGWIPPARYKGDPERFTDAETFIERGETVLPIVKKQLADSREETRQLREEQARTAAALRTAQEAIDQIEERHTVETQKAVAEARKQLKAQLAQASEAGDHEAIAELTDQMTQLNTADAEAKPAKKNGEEKPAVFTPPPELTAWAAENSWYGKDKRKTALALGIATELREAGDKSVGREFFDKVGAEVEKTLRGAEEPAQSKVEGSRHGADGESRGGARKTFDAMPADARAACDAESKRFVGKGKRYETLKDWRNRYAEIFFKE